jgi:hypothetical protein
MNREFLFFKLIFHPHLKRGKIIQKRDFNFQISKFLEKKQPKKNGKYILDSITLI